MVACGLRIDWWHAPAGPMMALRFQKPVRRWATMNTEEIVPGTPKPRPLNSGAEAVDRDVFRFPGSIWEIVATE